MYDRLFRICSSNCLAKFAYCAVEAFRLVRAFHRLQLVEIDCNLCSLTVSATLTISIVEAIKVICHEKMQLNLAVPAVEQVKLV